MNARFSSSFGRGPLNKEKEKKRQSPRQIALAPIHVSRRLLISSASALTSHALQRPSSAEPDCPLHSSALHVLTWHPRSSPSHPTRLCTRAVPVPPPCALAGSLAGLFNSHNSSLQIPSPLRNSSDAPRHSAYCASGTRPSTLSAQHEFQYYRLRDGLLPIRLRRMPAQKAKGKFRPSHALAILFQIPGTAPSWPGAAPCCLPFPVTVIRHTPPFPTIW